MAKSFCSGCIHWELYRVKPYGDNYDASERFHYCNKYNETSLKRRKTICNGVYYEDESILSQAAQIKSLIEKIKDILFQQPKQELSEEDKKTLESLIQTFMDILLDYDS